MSLSRDAILELMAFADGEADDASRARVEALLAESAEARAVIAAFGPIGDAVRDASEARVSAISVAARDSIDTIADAVMAEIDAGGGDVAHVPPAAMSSQAVSSNGASSGLRGMVHDEIAAARHRRAMRLGLAGAGAAVVALAAALVLVLRSPAADDGGGSLALGTSAPAEHGSAAAPPAHVPMPSPAAVRPESAVASVVAAAGVDVEHVDSQSTGVSIFYLPATAASAADAGASSVVVWIDEDKGQGGK